MFRVQNFALKYFDFSKIQEKQSINPRNFLLFDNLRSENSEDRAIQLKAKIEESQYYISLYPRSKFEFEQDLPSLYRLAR